MSKEAQTNDGIHNDTWRYDTGQSMAHLTFRATFITAADYIGDPSILYSRMQKSKIGVRERKEMDTFVFSKEIGKVSDTIK